MSRISWIPGALFAVAVPLFLITGGITWAFNNPGIYEGGFEKYNISNVTGITDEDLKQVSREIRSYFNSGEEPLAIRARSFGQDRDLFNPKEVIHMRDVKRLVWGVYVAAGVSLVYLLATAGTLALRHRRGSLEILARWLLWGSGLTVVLILAVGLFAVIGFDSLFLKFHQLFFTNDFWQGNSRTDFLVMLFPQDFWFDATIWVAIRAVIAGVIISAISGGYLAYRHLRRTMRTCKGSDWTEVSERGAG